MRNEFKGMFIVVFEVFVVVMDADMMAASDKTLILANLTIDDVI